MSIDQLPGDQAVGEDDTDLDTAPAVWPATDPDDPDRESTSSVALFEGDEGGLEVDQRRALVVLLKQRFITARTHPKEWQALTRNPRPIRARLNDLFLELRIDAEREVAYKRQVQPEGGGRPYPTLLYDAPWGREDTILLVYLRAHCRSEQAAGADRVFVDRDDMLEFIEQHRPEHATDQAGDARRAVKAIEALTKTGLLVGPAGADRFEISNAIEVLLPMDRLAELLGWLRQQNGTPPDTTDNPAADNPDPAGQENTPGPNASLPEVQS